MNVIYKRQLSILIFFAGLVFKISFLPVHITNAAANNNIVIILAYMIFDFALLGLVYYIIKNKAVQSLPKSFATFLMILLYIWFAIKFAIMSGEASFCVSENLFKDAYIFFIFVAIGAITSYIAIKGSTVLARLGEIFIVFVILFLFINVITVESETDIMGNLPLFDISANKLFSAFDKHYVWTGDFLPLIVFGLTDTKKKSKLLPWMIAGSIVMIFGHYIFLNALCRAGAAKIDNLIVELGTFNVGNILIGRTDALSFSVWNIMVIVSLSLTMLAATEASSYFLKDRRIGTAIVNVVAALFYIFGFKNVDKLYAFATGGIRYFMLFVQVFVPIVIIAGYNYTKRKSKATEKYGIDPSYMPDEKSSRTYGGSV